MKRKALSLALALTMCLSLTTTAFADRELTESNGKITYQLLPIKDTYLEKSGFFDGKYAVGVVKEADKDIVAGDIMSTWGEEKIEAVNPNAFYNCTKLTHITIPDTVLIIGDNAFSGCRALSEVTIPASVRLIGSRVFTGCRSLTKIEVAAGNPNYCSVDGVLFSKDMKTLIAYPIGKAGTSYTIPDTVTTVSAQAFQSSQNLTSVTIPSSVVSIESFAFSQFEAGMNEYYSVAHTERPAADQYTFGLKDVYYAGTEAQWDAITMANREDFIAAAIHYGNTAPSQPQQPAAPQAIPTNDTLKVNGEVQNATVYKIDDSNYFKIRDLAAVLNGTSKQFSVGYDEETQSVTAVPGQSYEPAGGELAGAAPSGQPAEASNDAIYVNGAKVEAQVYKIDGSNYFKLRDLGEALGFDVGWSIEEGMFINTEAYSNHRNS